MSRERARRREEREREAAVRAAARAAEAERTERRAARRRRLTRHLPARGAAPVRGGLADRRRRQSTALAGVIVTVLVLVYAFSESLGLTALVGVAALLGAPVLHTLMFRR